MYNRFFGFKERPFKLVPNPEYLYLSRIHEEVLAHLNYAAGFGEGFVEITGEVGTGKTTLCRMFLENLDADTVAAYIFNPKLDALQLLKAINDEFEIPSDADSIKILIDRLNGFLLQNKARGKRVILLVDEAQNLSPDVLEQLRLLSNLETTTSKLMQIILVGQPELGDVLESDALRQLNQRITLSCHLVPLDFAETREYIRHRIHIASRKPGLEFTAGAYRSIFKYSGGVPRLINIACDRTLLTAYTLGKHSIATSIVKQALRELEGKRRRSRPPSFTGQRLVIGLLVMLVVLVTGLIVGLAMWSQSKTLAPAPASVGPIDQPPLTPPAAPEAKTVKTEPTTAALPPSLPLAAAPTKAGEIPEPDMTADISPPPPVVDLEKTIATRSASNSRLGALRAVLGRWQINRSLPAGPVTEIDSETLFRIAARHSAMELLRVQGDLSLITNLNLPAILEFVRADGGTRYLAVVGFTGDDIRLSDGGEDAFSISAASLLGRWNGVAHIFWKNYYDYTGIIPISSPGEVILSLKRHLKTLGFPIQAMTAAYDTTTRLAVETIQARHGLDVDGMVGPLTMIALYNEDQSLSVPRLSGVTIQGPPSDQGPPSEEP